MEAQKGAVCVTGGTGFLASSLIVRLLEQGYSVHTTIRPDPENKRDVSFLTSLPGASEKLKIFQADLDNPESFYPAIEGCIGVFHVATPLNFENKEPQEVVVKRAIDGALDILKACLKFKTVKKVVYTSSAAAVALNNKGADVMDETFWTDTDYANTFSSESSYFVSKTLTEKAVLEFAEEHELDLVSAVPSLIVGPFICPKLPGSVHKSLALIFGAKHEHKSLLNVPLVHVDDVVRAHIFLFEHPKAKGRYICSSHNTTIEETAKFLTEKYPEYQIPTVESVKEIKGYKFPGLSSKKLLDSNTCTGLMKCLMRQFTAARRRVISSHNGELVFFKIKIIQ